MGLRQRECGGCVAAFEDCCRWACRLVSGSRFEACSRSGGDAGRRRDRPLLFVKSPVKHLRLLCSGKCEFEHGVGYVPLFPGPQAMRILSPLDGGWTL